MKPIHITAREAQVLALAARGHTTEMMAALLRLSPRTVEWHINEIAGKVESKHPPKVTVILLGYGCDPASPPPVRASPDPENPRLAGRYAET